MYLLIDDSPRRHGNRADAAIAQRPVVRTLIVLMVLTTCLALTAWSAAPAPEKTLSIPAAATD